jgi:hypothetical protein
MNRSASKVAKLGFMAILHFAEAVLLHRQFDLHCVCGWTRPAVQIKRKSNANQMQTKRKPFRK